MRVTNAMPCRERSRLRRHRIACRSNLPPSHRASLHLWARSSPRPLLLFRRADLAACKSSPTGGSLWLERARRERFARDWPFRVACGGVGAGTLTAALRKGVAILHAEHKTCIDACLSCTEECEHCATACLHEPDAAQRTRCIQVLRDCADVCDVSARWMVRDSSFVRPICELCADICDQCATECGRFRDDHCRNCADACRKCAQECRTMAGHVTAGIR